jgi:hypothetical protein
MEQEKKKCICPPGGWRGSCPIHGVRVVISDSPDTSAVAAQAERIARAFHESYERQAPEFGYRTREASAKPWEDVPADNKALMIAVVTDLLSRAVIR